LPPGTLMNWSADHADGTRMQRRRARFTGIVQGVGFRPFVVAAARRRGLVGFVCNEGDGVRVEAEGPAAGLDSFLDKLATQPPPGARIVTVEVEPVPPAGDAEFVIAPSRDAGGHPAFLPADVATCPACVDELFAPASRRFRYAFLSCTHCGPRFTVIESLPYDRERTTMVGFPLCPDCRREYEDPTDRRFHAQTIACPACGPRLTALDARGEVLDTPDPLHEAVDALVDGWIIGVKGLGGYHLACDARRDDTVTELRRRKHRDEKPLAVMVADLAAAAALCEIGSSEADLLASPQRPIVLLNRRANAGFAPADAPGQSLLGIMLPYTPLHHLLLRDFGGPLVMTSGNLSDEPVVFDDAEARLRLCGNALILLTHDRPIRSRCDDSVVRVVGRVELPVRRSRGYAPVPIPVRCGRPILAVGGDLKSVFALGRDGQAALSHHLGDLDGYEAYRAFAEAVADYERLFRFRREVIAHDLHPDYASTRYARDRAAADPDIRLVAVQHHHAHLVSCLAENGVSEPVIGVTFDGAGYGTDGTIWGGEFLVGDARGFRRAAHLRPVPLPGGDKATREPWRMAVAYLWDAGEGPDLLAGRVEPRALDTALAMIGRRLNSPVTSSAGRLFDAVAALIGLRTAVSYEGQAAGELEGLATGRSPRGAYPFGFDGTHVDTRPLIAALVADIRSGTVRTILARRFHCTVVEIIAATCGRLRDEMRVNAVALSGGVFLNAIVLAESSDRLVRDGFQVYRHRQVPPGDGGLCLGQLVIAAAAER
jgi:hydrogenase maturation protein HypF